SRPLISRQSAVENLDAITFTPVQPTTTTTTVTRYATTIFAARRFSLRAAIAASIQIAMANAVMPEREVLRTSDRAMTVDAALSATRRLASRVENQSSA